NFTGRCLSLLTQLTRSVRRASGLRSSRFIGNLNSSGSSNSLVSEIAVRTKPPAAADATRGHAQNIFLSQRKSTSISSVMIAKHSFAKRVFVEIEELLSTQAVRLLSP